mmetsp:Transcript_105004/g.327495  ORF Transcript_105004/g.327495 Transcript_105004/m.327495 type:complete len:332 (+) Transcript_105004:735-1730(+)
MLEGEHHAPHVVLGVLLAAVEALPVVGRVELTPERQLQQEVEVLVAVERLIQRNDEAGVRHLEDELFRHDAVLHAHLHDVALAEALHRVGQPRVLVLEQLHRAEAAAAQQADLPEVFPQDPAAALAPPLVAARRAHLQPLGYGGVCREVVRLLPVPAATGPGWQATAAGRLWPTLLEDVLQRPQQQVEGRAVQGQGHGGPRDHLDRGGARLVLEEGALAKVLGGLLLGAGVQACLLLAVDEDRNLPLVHDVEGVPVLALPHDHLVLLVVHLDHRLRHGDLLVVVEGAQQLALVQVADVLVDLADGALHEGVLEVVPVDDPDLRALGGRDRC